MADPSSESPLSEIPRPVQQETGKKKLAKSVKYLFFAWVAGAIILAIFAALLAVFHKRSEPVPSALQPVKQQETVQKLPEISGKVMLPAVTEPVSSPEKASEAAKNIPTDKMTAADKSSDKNQRLPLEAKDGGQAQTAPAAFIQTAYGPALPGLIMRNPYGDGFLPQISPSGMKPEQAYANLSGRDVIGPKIALIIGDAGLSAAIDEKSLTFLPTAVDFALSPYGTDLPALALALHQSGHEYLIEVPMESEGYPINNPGKYALLTGVSAEVNAAKLNFVLSRVTGYVGAIGAVGSMTGGRFTDDTMQFNRIVQEIRGHGLFYLSALPEDASFSFPVGRVGENINEAFLPSQSNGEQILKVNRVSVVLGESEESPAVLDADWNRLIRMARLKGEAIGFLPVLNPVALTVLAGRIRTLAADKVTLVPLSALIKSEDVKSGT